MHRAIEFIEANADLDISAVDIARAALATSRAVQLAFRRHLDTTPMAYLRDIRLQRAHDQLRDLSPDEGTTVTQVAARWGFASPSRFAQYYRAAYGVAPSHTLRD